MKLFKELKDDDFVEINSRLMELGNRQSEVTTHQYGTVSGVRLDLGETWELEFSAGQSQSSTQDVGVHGYARASECKKS